jgi:hypothetical protein
MYLRWSIGSKKLRHVWSRADKDARDQAYPNNRLGLFIFEAIGVQGGYARYEYACPAKGEAHVSVEVNLLEKIGSGKVLSGE